MIARRAEAKGWLMAGLAIQSLGLAATLKLCLEAGGTVSLETNPPGECQPGLQPFGLVACRRGEVKYSYSQESYARRIISPARVHHSR
jgi:hypothetical protein